MPTKPLKNPKRKLKAQKRPANCNHTTRKKRRLAPTQTDSFLKSYKRPYSSIIYVNSGNRTRSARAVSAFLRYRGAVTKSYKPPAKSEPKHYQPGLCFTCCFFVFFWKTYLRQSFIRFRSKALWRRGKCLCLQNVTLLSKMYVLMPVRLIRQNYPMLIQAIYHILITRA